MIFPSQMDNKKVVQHIICWCTFTGKSSHGSKKKKREIKNGKNQ